MKVLILGPVINNTSGGVAVFTENLYRGFKELGDNVQIISNTKSSSLNNLKIKDRNISKNKIILYFRRIAKIIKEFEPDLVISSLQYSIGIKKYKKSWKKATYVQVLHGVPNKANGRFKSFIINSVARFSKKHFDKVVTVSFLSYALNKRMNLIECDKVIHNSCALQNTTKKKTIRIYDITYVGRLSKNKGIELICDSYLELRKEHKDIKLCIAGYGELENLFIEGKYKNSGIIYLGKLNQKQVQNILIQTKFFISLFPLETFATTYLEAIVNGCNVIAPSTSGTTPLFLHKKYFHIADCINKNELTIRLKQILNNYVEVPEKDVNEYSEYFSPKRCAQEYKDLVIKK